MVALSHKMLKHHEPISAFAMYSKEWKQKSGESPVNPKKLKGKQVCSENGVASKSNARTKNLGKRKESALHENAQPANSVSTNKIHSISKGNNSLSKYNLSMISVKSSRIKKTRCKRKGKNILAISSGKVRQTKKQLKKSDIAVNVDIAKIKKTGRKLEKNKDSKLKKTDVKNISHANCTTSEDNHENPLKNSRSMFEWVIHPMNVEEFFEKNWEKTPVHIKRSCPSYYKLLMSTPLLDKILRDSHILFTKNIDITSYENSVRETHNPAGRAVPSVVWDYYMNGCSIRMLNPQTYIPKLHSLNATLQELFGCFVGANSYLTPPNSQGFAPHYDDIEAFILQVEGKKRWRLYKPRNENEYLPRYSSKNFSQSEIGEPILDTILNAGDLLYFPRGTIHQGETIDDTHSLHITLSVYQRNNWGDFLLKLLPQALTTAIESNSEFREGLPTDYLTYTGYAYSDVQNKNKEKFKTKIKDLFSKLVEYIDIDTAADLMAKSHIHDFLPPVLSETEKECSVVEDGEKMIANGVVENRVEIEPDTRIRLLRSHCLRLIKEDEVYRIYYSTENSKEYHEYEPQFLEVGEEFVPAIREIILRYPDYITVEDLPINGEDNKIQIVKDLWEKCLVVTDNPLCVLE